MRLGGELRPLPAGLTGMIPTRLDALASSGILSPEGLARFARESELPAGPEAGDESIAAFVTRRMGREAYERLVEPLMSGIYAGDGEQLSLAATFPNLRQLEREYGSVTRGLLAGGSESAAAGPPFLSLRGGMRDLVAGLADRLARTTVVTGRAVASVRRAARWPRLRAGPRRRRDARRRGRRARDAGIRHRRARGVAGPAARRGPCGDPVRVDRRS